MMETKQCATCGKVLPLNKDHFYWNREWRYWRANCKECQRKISRDAYHKHNPPQPKEPREIITGQVDCPGMNKEAGKCFEIGCRYHMVVGVNKNPVDKILRAKCTCLFEITESFPDGLDQTAIAGIMGVSKQRISQIEAEAITKLKEAGSHLEELLEDDVEYRYQRPHEFLNDGKLSEKNLVPVWHPNNGSNKAFMFFNKAKGKN